MNDLLASENARLRREVADLQLELDAARAALAAERDAHQVSVLKLEAECAAGDLRITTVTYDELRDIWRNQDLRAELDLLDAQARDEARARGNWDEPTRRERPVVSERLTIKVEPMTMRELVYGGAAVVNRPRAITIIGPMPTRRPAFTSKRPQVVQIVVPESLDNFDEVFW